MFGILWGVIAVVILSATGEGFQRGNEHVLEELGKNIAIVWGGRTSLQAGGERAGRADLPHASTTRVPSRASRGSWRVVSPEIQRGGLQVEEPLQRRRRSRVHGIEPQYQDIRTIDIERGRSFALGRRAAGARAWRSSAPTLASSSSARATALGETVQLNGVPLHRRRQDPEEGPGQQLQRARQRQGVRAVRGDGARLPAARRAGRARVSQIIVAPKPVGGGRPAAACSSERTGRIDDIDWPLERDVRQVLARRHGFDPDDREAIAMWDTSLETLMFGRMIDTMRDFFSIVGFVTLALGGLGVMNIMLVAVRERTREIGVRKALGATTRAIQRQFFLEGFFLTLFSGGARLRRRPRAVRAGQPAADARALPGHGDHLAGRRARPRHAALAIVGVVTSHLPGAPRGATAAGRGAAVRDVTMSAPTFGAVPRRPCRRRPRRLQLLLGRSFARRVTGLVAQPLRARCCRCSASRGASCRW